MPHLLAGVPATSDGSPPFINWGSHCTQVTPYLQILSVFQLHPGITLCGSHHIVAWDYGYLGLFPIIPNKPPLGLLPGRAWLGLFGMGSFPTKSQDGTLTFFAGWVWTIFLLNKKFGYFLWPN